MTRLWKVENGQLAEVATASPKSEKDVEDWIEKDPSILGLDLLVIARQFTTDFGGKIDLLGIDQEGDLTLIEMKRDKAPREAVAQTLDYGSWVKGLTTPRIHSIANTHLKRPLSEAFHQRFDQHIPETLNSSHNLLIVASGFDPSSRRIVEYLAETHGVSINTAFFSYFRDGENEFLASDFLLDQEQVGEWVKTKAPWTGYYYVNAGEWPGLRNWEDMRNHGFIAAGRGRRFSIQLSRLSRDDRIFVYQKGAGYVGYGVVSSQAAVMAKDFITEDGRSLDDLKLQEQLNEPGILHDRDDPELSDYLVSVQWKKTFPKDDPIWQGGLFTSQLIVCKLRHPTTLDILEKTFGVEPAAGSGTP
jgi:hypothetical protein